MNAGRQARLAIREGRHEGHTSGLARGYGYTLTYAAAQKYCPPNADHWYNSCLAQMNSI